MSVVQNFNFSGVDGGGLFEVFVAWSSMLSLGTGTGCGGYKLGVIKGNEIKETVGAGVCLSHLARSSKVRFWRY